CNGFQALVKLGLLPRAPGEPLRQRVSLVHNGSGRYECRWVRLRVEDGPCRFLPRGATLEMPVGHGEGKLVFADEDLHRQLAASHRIPVRYVDEQGQATEQWPANPNGSLDGAAGLCDRSGRVFGLMPHPEAFLYPENHPRWLAGGGAESGKGYGMGLRLFANGLRAARVY
ncbi:MAG: phosphoribosylformylglycinamidine synthase subunit PurQ, partial [Myxococcales bacterium]|nr:phosphoribosylformylglycinamidine synthase subunit PurQ [Myxococcales bacterium]